MLQVDLNNILPEEDALQRIQDIFSHVENNKEIYVITKGGRPAFAIVDIEHLENTMGGMEISDTPTAPTPEPTPSFVAPSLPPVPPLATTSFPPSSPAVDSPIFEEPLPAMPSLSTPPVAQPTTLTPPPPVAPASPAPQPNQPATPANMAAPTTALPPLSGSLDLPEMPEDPSNSSPLA